MLKDWSSQAAAGTCECDLGDGGGHFGWVVNVVDVAVAVEVNELHRSVKRADRMDLARLQLVMLFL